MFAVSSADEFREVWNRYLGYTTDGYPTSVEDVIIIAHASICGEKNDDTAQSYLYFTDENGTETRLYAKYNAGSIYDDISMLNLNSVNMEWLTFSACNTGNPDVYNWAYAFKIKMSVSKYIVAWDGGTIFDYITNELKAGPDRNQHTWYKYVDKNWCLQPLRERIGYRQIKG